MASTVKEQKSDAVEGTSCGHQFRSCDQINYGTSSLVPPYWDYDVGGDGEPRPCELYGAFVWKINGFSQENQKELRSKPFEAGGYKWYILIYPQGCDVYNHLSLFLCVANHEKLRPGWGHYAQFTITLVHKDPNKSKYSDTLHRFWKKEHDWGWKKFAELSKVLDEFVEDDTLTIKAQVQVIRERQDKPFPCLSSEYRRELLRVYQANVEQILRRFVEERRGKIWKLIEDKARWSSLHTFWADMDQSSKRSMSRTKMDAILKVIVKNFFVEKEVNSTIVMDSLHSGLISLECQSPAMKKRATYFAREDIFYPIVHMEEDAFVLVNDVLPLLKRAAVETLPPKYERGPQHRVKHDVVSVEDFFEDYSMWDERRLTQFGRRTIEIFVLTHIFGKFEAAYQEAVALRMQEELIQEEAAMLAMNGQKGRRGGAADKEKKSKKKQGKQKRRKGKDKGNRDDKSRNYSQGTNGHESDEVEGNDALSPDEAETGLEKSKLGDDPIDRVPEIPPQDSEIGGVQNGAEGGSSSVMCGDNSSTCSSDSFTAVVVRRAQNGNRRNKKERNPVISRGKNHAVSDPTAGINGEANKSSTKSVRDSRKLPSEASQSSPAVDFPEQQHALKKNEKPASSSSSVLPRVSESVQASAKLSPDNEVTPVATEKPVEKPSTQRVPIITTTEKPSSVPVLSRPSSAPMPSEPRPVIASTESTRPVLSRSTSVSGQLGPESAAPAVQSYVVPSYRNAIIGGPSSSVSYAQATSLAASSPAMRPLHESDTIPELNQMNPNFPIGAQNGPILWESTGSFDLYDPLLHARPRDNNNNRSSDNYFSSANFDFPHLDIINDLLDDEHGIEGLSISGSSGHGNHTSNGLHFMDRRFGFPGEVSGGASLSTSQWHYDVVPQVSLQQQQQHRVRGNGGGGFLQEPNHRWHSTGSDDMLPYHQMNIDSNGYGYHTNYRRGIVDANGYALFRPASNGR